MWWTAGRVLDDVAPAAWLGPRLVGPVHAVTTVVPCGFDVYARILHPVANSIDRITWAMVAEQVGVPMHATIGWRTLLRAATGPIQLGGSTVGQQTMPSDGTLPDQEFAALCGVLGGHTADAEDCYAAVWDGYGWENRSIIVSRDGQTCPGENPVEPWRLPSLTPAERTRPRIRLGALRYHVLAGPLPRAEDFDFVTPKFPPDTAGPFLDQSPNVFWPGDRAWCVATDIDHYATLVGGSRDLIAQVLAHPDLEAWQVAPTDSLADEGYYG